MARILVISIAFPPKADPECIQTARYCYQLSLQKDTVIDVVTSENPTLFMPIDETLKKYAQNVQQLVEIPIYESKYVTYLLRKIRPAAISRPDSKMTFHWQWKKALKQLREIPDVIYSRSNPLSSAIMALKVAKHLKKPWLMHLSDPWVENALYHYAGPEMKYHARMEAECFAQAAAISFTSEKTLHLYSKKYPAFAGKMYVFPNVYDTMANVEAKTRHSPSGRIRIVYTGGLANTRTAESLLRALALTARNAPHLTNRMEVIFAGDIDRNNAGIMRKFSLPFVHHAGRVPAETAAKMQANADLLVVIDSIIADPEKAVFFPSKLLDYARLRKPVLAITDKGSVTDVFVRAHGGVTFPHENEGELSGWLQSYLEGNIVMAVRELDPFYSAEAQAARLHALFENLTK